MSGRSYGQHCAVAKSLDLVGDRWTLLVVRELLDGPRRYGDLLTSLAPIATDILAARLRDLEAYGLVCKRPLPKPAAGSAYELTDDGLALEEVVNAFARWGRRLIETREPGDVVRPQWLARAVRAYARPDYRGPEVVVRLVIPQGAVTLRIGPGGVEELDDDQAVDVTLTGNVDALAAALDTQKLSVLVAAGRLRIDGKPTALRRLAKAVDSQWFRD